MPLRTGGEVVSTAGVLRSAAVAAAIGVGTWVSLFRPLDGLIADLGFRWSPVQAAAGHHVLLVEAPIEVFVSTETDWQGFVRQLLALGAERVAFTALPTLEPAKLSALLSNPKVDAAAAVDVDPRNSEGAFLRVPSVLSGIDIPSVAHHGASSFGIHRKVPGPVVVASSELPSLELLTAQRVGRTIPAGELLIDFFTGPPETLPRASFDQVRSEKLIPEALRGRVALVGPVSNRFEASVVTPLTTPRVTVSELEFHAYALNTLLRGSTIRTLPVAFETGLVGLAWLATAVIAVWVRFRRAWVLATLAVLALLTLEIALLPLAHFHLPVVAMILVIATTTVVVLQSKSRRQASQMRSLVTTTSVALANRWAPDAPMEEKAFWPHLLAMVDQLLPLSRSALLIREQETDLLRLQGTLRCNQDDIADRRRDLRRPPFTEARSASEPHPVPEFLRNAGSEQTFMLPLEASERLVGFWVFSVNSLRVVVRPTLMEAFRRVADEIAESVVAHQAHQETDPRSEPLGTDRELQRLADNLRAIDRHFRLSEHIFMGLRTPTVVFDVFGRTIAMNERMKDVFNQSGDPALASAPYLLETLCQLSPESAREAIAAVVFESHEFEHTARCGEDRYILRATTLRETTAHGPNTARAVQGLQIELLPLAQLQSQGADVEVDVWEALERAVGRIAALPQFESLEFEMDGARDLPPVTARPQPFTEALAAVMQLLAEDATLPGTVCACVNEIEANDGREIAIILSAKGFGLPPDALHDALDGPHTPASGPLRQIRTLREAAFGGGTFDVQSELGQGYRVRIAMPAAR